MKISIYFEDDFSNVVKGLNGHLKELLTKEIK